MELGSQIENKSDIEIKNLDVLLQRFLTIVNTFPAGLRTESVCGDWGLREVLAHLSAWNRLTIRDLDKHRNGAQIEEWILDSRIDDFNAAAVALTASHTWGQVYNEFIASTQALVLAYRGISLDDWSKQFGPETGNTPYTALLIDIAHYNDHLEQLRTFLSEATKTWPASTQET